MKKIPEIPEESKKEDDNSVLSEGEIKQRSETIRVVTDVEEMMRSIKRTLENYRATNIKFSFSRSNSSSEKPCTHDITLTKRYNGFDNHLPNEEEYVLKEIYNALFTARITPYKSAKIVPSSDDTDLSSDLEETWYSEQAKEQASPNKIYISYL